MIAPDLQVPQTFQMLVSNVLLDGVTMLVTFELLAWAVKKHTMLRIPAAISFDVVVAAVLACASLYFGLVLTEQALTIIETINVLLGRAPEGIGVEFGPYFWAMHTTFLPTLVYIGLILLTWLAKVLLGLSRLFFKIGYESSNPLSFTYGVLNAVWAMFAATAGIMQVLK